MDEVSIATVWLKLESRYISKSLTKKFNLKWKIYGFKMAKGTNLPQHNSAFNQVVSDTLRIDIKFDDEDKAMMLLIFLPASYEHLVTTLCWGKRIWNLKRS